MKKVISKKQMIKTVENCLMVVLGTAILGFGTAVFLVPFNLVTGGMTGLAIVLDQLLPFDVSIDLYISVLTWFLFFVGLVFLGKKFAAKTLLSAIFYPVFFSLFHRLVDPSVLGGLFVLQNTAYRDNAVLLAAVFGGVLEVENLTVNLSWRFAVEGNALVCFWIGDNLYVSTVCSFFHSSSL
jgi:uncharacterized membrane-anchored protein YitT (DUF2179 family)